MGIITAADHNVIHDAVFNLMGTNSSGYGAILKGGTVTVGEYNLAQQWNSIRDDLSRVIVHQTGITTNNIPIVTTSTVIAQSYPNLLYATTQALTASRDTVAANQLVGMRINTYQQSDPNWVTNWTVVPATGYTAAATYTWFYPIHLNYFFNLGGNIRPEISAQGPDFAAWQPVISLANSIVLGKTQFLSALANGNTYKTQVVTGTGNTRKTIIIQMTVISSQIQIMVTLLAGQYSKKKKKGGDVPVNLQVYVDFLTKYSIDNNGGIAAPIPQSQLMNHCLSSPTAPIPVFTAAAGQPTQTRIVTLNNNSNQTCTISGITLTGYTTGTVHLTSNVIPPYSNTTLSLQYQTSAAGVYRGFVNISSNVNNLTLFTELEIGKITPASYSATVTELGIIYQDFYVELLGGKFRDFSVTLTGGAEYSLLPYIPLPYDERDVTGFRVYFDPSLAPNGLRSATANVTVFPYDNNLPSVSLSAPLQIIRNIVPDQHLGGWISAKGLDNSVVGLSYDIKGGARYLTVGAGAVPTIAASGTPSLTELRTNTFHTWREVYRIHIDGPAKTYHSKDYIIQGPSFEHNHSLNYFFGVGKAKNSMLTVIDDGAGNLTVLMNTVREYMDTSPDMNTVYGIESAFYYYDETVNRVNQLEARSEYTTYFQGFTANGTVVTTKADTNLN